VLIYSSGPAARVLIYSSGPAARVLVYSSGPAARVLIYSCGRALYACGQAARADGVMEQLPVVTREIGDTWLYGDPSDPLKNVHFREMSRVRAACVRDGACDPASATMRRFDRLLTKIPEHTWGYALARHLHPTPSPCTLSLRPSAPLPASSP
jgi:hypothetical protein